MSPSLLDDPRYGEFKNEKVYYKQIFVTLDYYIRMEWFPDVAAAGMRGRFDPQAKWDGKVRKFASEAATHYSKTAAALVEMRELFPFPHGGQPDDPVVADRAVQLLREAKEVEVLGVEVMERLLNFMKAYSSETRIN
jgi:hypothetical protein